MRVISRVRTSCIHSLTSVALLPWFSCLATAALRRRPGNGKDLDGAGGGFDAVGGGAGGDGYVANSKGVKDVQRSCPALRVGHVMVAGEEEDGDAGEGEAAYAAGEFSLVGLGAGHGNGRHRRRR